MRCVRNVAALSELNNLSLSIFLFDHRKCCICEVQIALGTSLKASSPPNRVDKATLIALHVGYAKGIADAMLEGCERYAESRVEDGVESERTIEVVVRVVEREFKVFRE
jgi:hypothetical protein